MGPWAPPPPHTHIRPHIMLEDILILFYKFCKYMISEMLNNSFINTTRGLFGFFFWGGGGTKESGLKLQRAREIHNVDIWGTAEVKTNVCLLSFERYIFLCRSTYLFLRHWIILYTWGYIRKI